MTFLPKFIHRFSKILTVYRMETDKLTLKSHENKNNQNNQEILDVGDLTLPDDIYSLL